MTVSTSGRHEIDAERGRLAAGVAALGLALDSRQLDQLLAYLGLLDKWNRVYNLTAVRQPADMVVRHLLDSLAIVPHVRGPRVLDVGTGAGLPGIPLAIVFAEHRCILLDSRLKKTRFVVQAAAELGLRNVEVVQARAEDYRPATLFDTVVSRAFATVQDMVAVAGGLCAVGGQLLAMKGRYPAEELKSLPGGFRLREAARLNVPELGGERHVILIGREAQ